MYSRMLGLDSPQTSRLHGFTTDVIFATAEKNHDHIVVVVLSCQCSNKDRTKVLTAQIDLKLARVIFSMAFDVLALLVYSKVSEIKFS